MANGKLIHNSDGLNAQNLPSGRVPGQSKALRDSIEPLDNSMVMVKADSSQVEARVLGYEANDQELLHQFRTGICPYSQMAVAIWNEYTWEEIKKRAKAEEEPFAGRRQIGKSAVLGAGFGLGAAKYQDYVKTTTGIAMEADMCKHVIRTYRRERHMIVKAWKTGEGVLDVLLSRGQMYFGGPENNLFFVDGQRTLMGRHIPGIRIPDGNWISYPDLHRLVVNSPILDPETGDLIGWEERESVAYKSHKGRGFELEFLHGPKVIQNVTQATAFAAMKYQAQFLEFPLVINTHDEHVSVAPRAQETRAVDNMTFAMSQIPPWLDGCPLACETKAGRTYGELK